MHETSGVLEKAMLAFLRGDALSQADIGALRAYLRQWIGGPWYGPTVSQLRADIDGLTDRAAIDRWLSCALDAGVDPL